MSAHSSLAHHEIRNHDYLGYQQMVKIVRLYMENK